MSLTNRVAVLTGATRGIGLATAEALAHHRVRLALLARSSEALQAVAGRLANYTATLPVPCDVTDYQQVRTAVQTAAGHFGELDILINNAGVYVEGPIAEANPTHYEALFAVNVKGLIFMTQAVLPHLRPATGHIVNVASIAGLMGLSQQSLFCASKFAVVGFSRALAAELKPSGLRVTTICPGPVNTWGADDSTGLLSPEDAANAIVAALATRDAAVIDEIVLNPTR